MSLKNTTILNEMREFEKSPAYTKHYNKMVELIRGCNGQRRITSTQLEGILSIGGGQIRNLVKHARRSEIPIGSDSDGYFYAKSREELDTTICHMKDRMNSIKFTVESMKNIFDLDADEEEFYEHLQRGKL